MLHIAGSWIQIALPDTMPGEDISGKAYYGISKSFEIDAGHYT